MRSFPPVVITTSATTFDPTTGKRGNCLSICCPEVLPEPARLVNCRCGNTVRRDTPFMSADSSGGFVTSLSKYEYPRRAPKPAVTLSPIPTSKHCFSVQVREKEADGISGPAGPAPIGRLCQKCK